MNIKTYYWHDNLLSRAELEAFPSHDPRRSGYFVNGNVGDTFTRDIISFFYQSESTNIRVGANRLMLTGSIAHLVSKGDVLCGVGIKRKGSVPAAGSSCAPASVLALRGQISYDEFRNLGYDMSKCGHLGDPGLLVRFMINSKVEHLCSPTVGFIPHYRERWMYPKGKVKNVQIIDVDSDYIKFSTMILSCQLILSSSLHGIVFSHALGRPVIPVRPQTEEPIIKYEDYFSGIGIPMPKPLESIEDFRPVMSPDSPISLKYKPEDFNLPSIEELTNINILS